MSFIDVRTGTTLLASLSAFTWVALSSRVDNSKGTGVSKPSEGPAFSSEESSLSNAMQGVPTRAPDAVDTYASIEEGLASIYRSGKPGTVYIESEKGDAKIHYRVVSGPPPSKPPIATGTLPTAASQRVAGASEVATSHSEGPKGAPRKLL